MAFVASSSISRTISAASQSNNSQTIKRRLKDQLLQPICKIFKERVKGNHQTFTLQEEAQLFLESYLLDKLALLCATPIPQKESEVEARRDKLFGNHVVKQAAMAAVGGSSGGVLAEPISASSSLLLNKSNKKRATTTLLPLNLVHGLLKDAMSPHKMDHNISLRFCLLLENILTEILRLVIIYMNQISLNDYRLTNIERCDVEVVINTYFEESEMDKPPSGDEYLVEFPNDYSNAVKELVHLENIYQRQLDIIIKLFRAPFEECFPRSADIHTIFSRIDALHECTSQLHSALEDSQEVMEKPLIGACFYDLAEGEAFNCYAQYAHDVLKPRCVERLYALLDNDQLRAKLIQFCNEIQEVASVPPKSSSTWSVSTGSTTLSCNSINAAGAIASSSASRSANPSSSRRLFTSSSSSSSSYSDCILSHSGDNANFTTSEDGASIQDATNDTITSMHPGSLARLKAVGSSMTLGSMSSLSGFTPALERLYVTGSITSLASTTTISTSSYPLTERQPLLNAARHLLPYLLLVPVFHFCHYKTILQRFLHLSDGEDSDDKLDLQQDLSMLMRDDNLVQRSLNASCSSPSSLAVFAPNTWLFKRFFFRNRTSSSSVNARLNRGKLHQLQESVHKFKETMDALGLKTWNEFIYEGTLLQKYDRNKYTERYVFLFDTMLLLCKALQRTGLASAANKQYEYKLKKLVPLQRERCLVVDILAVEKHDDEERHLIDLEFKERDGTKSTITLATRNAQDKKDWIATLMALQYWTTWENYLDMNNPVLNIPLDLMPFTEEEYAFAAQDSESNIEFDENAENNSGGNPIIIKATLNKLLERITYPAHMDIKLMDNFLMTFRDFTTPRQLLSKLIERFNIPEVTEESFAKWLHNHHHPQAAATATDKDELQREAVEWLRRFKKFTLKPIQLRVLNMMKKWIENYYGDFEHDKILTQQLLNFLESEPCQSREMRMHCSNITKALRRHQEGRQKIVSYPQLEQDSYPTILWHVVRAEDADRFTLMNLHPLELGRQITLLMHDLYRRIDSSELVTGAWNKVDRWTQAPNVMKFIRFANKLPWWCEVCICQASNLEERQQVFLRVYELLKVFDKLQNYAAAMSLVAVFGASSTQQIRLPHTWWVLKDGDEDKFLTRMRELVGDGRGTKFQQELVRSITAPCVPPLGPVLTHITMLLQQKSDRADAAAAAGADAYSNNPPRLLDVANMRKLSTIITDLLQFRSPYPYQREPHILEFLRSLDPARMLDPEYSSDGKATQDIQDFIDEKLYNISLEIEPRDCALEDLPVGKCMYSSMEIKSPGINLNMKSTRGGRQSSSGIRSIGSANISRSNSPPASPRLPSPIPYLSTNVAPCSSPLLYAAGGNGSILISNNSITSPTSHDPAIVARNLLIEIENVASAAATTATDEVGACADVHGHSKSDSDVLSSSSPPPLPPRRGQRPRLHPRQRFGLSGSNNSGGTLSIGSAPPLPPRLSTRRQQSATPPPQSNSSGTVSPHQHFQQVLHGVHQVQQVRPAVVQHQQASSDPLLPPPR